MIKEKIDKIALIFVCIIFLVMCVLIGTPVNNNYSLISVIINFATLIYIINVWIIDKKYKILNKDIVCIGVILLVFSSVIPYLAGKAVSASGTVEHIIKYFSLFSLYILVSNIECNKKIPYILNTVLAGGIVLCVIALDNLTINLFSDIMANVGVLEFYNPDKRLIGNFGYANTLAIYLVICFYILLYKILVAERKIYKSLFGALLLLIFICILLTLSRGAWLVCLIAFPFSLFFLSDKKKRYEQIFIVFLNVIVSLIVYKFWKSSIQYMNYLNGFGVILIGMLANTFLLYVVQYILPIIEKIRAKYIIITFILVIIVGVIIFAILLKYTEPLVLFESIYSADKYIQIIEYIKLKDNNCNVLIDLESKVKSEVVDAFEICIQEKNKYNDTVMKHSIKLKEYVGIEEINFLKQKDTEYLAIEYKCLNTVARDKLIINEIKINGENAQLSYKYIPNEIAYKIKSIGRNVMAVWERGVFITDGIKLSIETLLTGTGGNSWKYLQGSVQEYNYYAEELHSYPIEIMLEFGIVGVIGLMLIIIGIIIKLFKRNDNYILILSILILIIHSCVDFDMSFMIMQILFICFLGMLKSENKVENSFINIIVVSIIVIVLILSSLWCISNICFKLKVEEKNDKVKNAKFCILLNSYNIEAIEYVINNDKNNTKEIEWIIKNEPYYLKGELLYNISQNKNISEDLLKKYIDKNVYMYKKNIDIQILLYNVIKEICMRDDVDKNKWLDMKEEKKNTILDMIDNPSCRVPSDLKEYYFKSIEN